MKSSFEEKKEKLNNIYDRFERENIPFRQQAFCKPGCSFCCTFMGNIDIVTIEGLIILEHIGSQPEEFKSAVKNKISENRTEKDKGNKPPCPFLQENAALSAIRKKIIVKTNFANIPTPPWSYSLFIKVSYFPFYIDQELHPFIASR